MTPSSVRDGDLELALRLAEESAELAMALQARPVEVTTKTDGTPVTSVDLEVERLVLRALALERPDDAVLSEEAGERGGGRRRWILDPIDGTSDLLAGDSSWGTHIALEVDGAIVIGVITRPSRGEVWWAARGRGAHRRSVSEPGAGEPLRVSTAPEVAGSRLSVWSQRRPTPGAVAVTRRAQTVEPSIDDILLLTTGRIDGVILLHPGMAGVWDHAPGVVIVEEAGGRFTDPHGGSRIDLGAGIYSNGRLHGDLVSLLGGHIEIGQEPAW